MHFFQGGYRRVFDWRPSAKLCLWSACLLIFVINAAAYVWLHCNPLPYLDDWYSVDVFASKIFSGGLSFHDFFPTQATHSQPLNMLVLYLDVKLIGLDFTFEALAGLLFGIAALGLIFLFVRKDIPGACADSRILVCLLAVAGVFLSMNGSGNWDGIYNQSMEMLGFSLHLLALVLIWLSWRALETGRWRMLLLAGLLVGICADDSAIIVVAACVGGMLLIGLRSGRLRDAVRVIGTLTAALLIAQLFYMRLRYGQGPAIDSIPLAQRIAILRSLLPDAGKWLVIPSAASLAQAGELRFIFGGAWQSWQLALGSLMLVGQLWFWLTIWRVRTNGLVFAAVCLMLLAYGYWAGILYGRVIIAGSDYLQTERYALFYLLVPVALLLLAAERLSTPRTGYREKTLITLFAMGVIALQLPLSLAAWRRAENVDKAHQAVARVMFATAHTQENMVWPECRQRVFVWYVCKLSETRRAELFRIMERNRLSLFSPEFDDRHGMHEQAAR